MAASCGPDMVTDNLILHLDAGSSKSYGGSGTTWYDISGAGNNSTLVSSPTYSSLDSLGSFTFNGSTQYVSTLTASGVQTFTITMWFKTTSTASNATYWQTPQLFGKSNGGGASGDFGIFVNGGSIGYWSGIAASDTSWTGTSVNDGRWKNVSVVSNGSATTLYLNDVLQAGSSISVSRSFNSEAFWIGGKGGTELPGSYLACSIGKVFMYNRNLSNAEISQNFNSVRGRYSV